MKQSLTALLFVLLLPFAAMAKPAATLQSAAECGTCHQDHLENWRNSLHALSWSNPIFQAAYQKAFADSGGKAAKLCLPCHAPVATVSGDWQAKNELTREGITCDFCHSVEDVKKGKLVLKPGNVKFSSLKGSNVKEHGGTYSEPFATARLCAACHEHTNGHGAKVGTTYSEWQRSRFAETNVQCQHCHMAAMPGRTARENGREGIHDHSLAHSMDTMKGAVLAEPKAPVRMEESVLADVLITNVGAGHAIPTGTPARTLVLEVRSLDAGGKVIETKKREYRKRILDAKKRELFTDGDAFMYGVKTDGDNRLMPGESRLETFRFTARMADIVKIEAEVYLLYRPPVTTQMEMRIPLSAGVRSAE